jgi:hypothetical protein
MRTAAAAASCVALLALPVVLAAAACGAAPSDARIGIDAPDRTQFPPVADFLGHRCGSLDCHGNAQRNFIIYGTEGLRLTPPDASLPFTPGGQRTSVAEYDATYRSLVGLEPTLMSEVVAGHGAHPEVLTFVRKARGEEHHKGGQLITPGDDQDVCIATWLAGQTDTTRCANALNTP